MTVALQQEEARADTRLYRAYCRERDLGINHADIVATGVYPRAEAYAMQYSLAESAYVDALKQSARNALPTTRFDTDTYGRPLRV